jgi:hypothetical protein
VEAAAKVERLAAPAPLDERDAFLHARPAVLSIGLEGLVVLQRAAAADTHVEPTAAHHVEHRELLGQVDRMVQREETHAHAQSKRAGTCGEERRQHRRGGTQAVVVEVMLGDPHRVIAHRLGSQHLLERRIVYALLAPRLVPLHQKEQSEVHGLLATAAVVVVRLPPEGPGGRIAGPALRGRSGSGSGASRS